MTVVVDAVTVRVALAVPFAGRVTLDGLTVAGSEAPGKKRDRATVPAKPFTLMMVTVE